MRLFWFGLTSGNTAVEPPTEDTEKPSTPTLLSVDEYGGFPFQFPITLE